jgi:Uma2 family endonuclease
MSTATTTPTQAPEADALNGSVAGAPPAAPAPLGLDDLYRMNVDEYERISGMLDEDRIELIDGYLVRKMGKKPPHVWAVETLLLAFLALLPIGYFCRKEDPVRFPDLHEPEPDVAVIRGSRADFRGRIPDGKDIALLVEVSETTLGRDQGPKLLAYARAGILHYWIVNLVDGRIEVYTDPSADGYKTRQDFQADQDVPLVIDGTEVGRIAVNDILS